VVVREITTDVDLARIVVPGPGQLPGGGVLYDARTVDLPGGIFVSGRRYNVTIEAFDALGGLACTTSVGCVYADARVRSSAGVEFLTLGPDVSIVVSGGLNVGETVVLGARLVHTGAPVAVDAVGFIGLPNGTVLSGVAPGVTLQTTLTAVVFDNLFSHTFTPEDSPGPYVLGIRLVDPATRATLAQASRTVQR